MGVNAISDVAKAYDTKTKDKVKPNESKKEAAKSSQSNADTAAVYEKSDQSTDDSPKIYKRDNATVERLKQEVDQRTQSLRDLVEKMLVKQGKKVNDATDIYKLLREGKVNVDPETSAQAKKDIAEDGYWGVDKTSERLVSFAKALSGGDPSKADLMIESVKKGFDAATKTWGDKLPSICKDTMDATIKKLEDWRDSKSGDVTNEDDNSKDK